MKKNRILLRSSSWSILLLLVLLSLSAGPLAAQTRPLCTESSVMGWNANANNGTTFTMTKDCNIQTGGGRHWLELGIGKVLTINGAGYTIYAADRARYSNNSGSGTLFGFGALAGNAATRGQGIHITLRNVTIRGGGTDRIASGAPDPAINAALANITLDNVTFRDTRGGAIRKTRAGKITIKNSTFSGNQVGGGGSANRGAAITMDNGELVLQNLFTAKTNTGGRGAIFLGNSASLDIDALGCLDLAGNTADIYPTLTGALKTQWDGVQRKATDNCDATTTPTPTATATPVTPAPDPAPSPPSCWDDFGSVLGWNSDAASGTTFTMTKDCTIAKSGSFINTLHIRDNKTFIIDGAGYTIHAADKAQFNDRGTVFNFDGGSNISLTLRNLTIAGGGDAASPTGNDPDPAIIVRNNTLVLDGVTIQNTRGGAIRIINSGKVLLKNSTFTGNQVSGTGAATEGSVITVFNGGRLFLQNLFTAKNNTGGKGAIYVKTGGAADIYGLGCLDLSGNQNAGSSASDIEFDTDPAGFQALWDGKPTKSGNNCDASTVSTTTASRPGTDPTPPPTPTPTPAPAAPSGGGGGGGGQLAMKMAMADVNYGRRVKGTLGLERSAYYHKDSSGVLMLQIYRVDGNSSGHWVMNVPQAAIDAVSGPACVASSPDGRFAVRVWADRNITISDGPDQEGKVFHNTLQGGVNGPVIATQTTYSSTPPGVGCPGYTG